MPVDDEREITWAGRIGGHKWFLMITALWTARMAFATLALAVPFFVEVYYEVSARRALGQGQVKIKTVPWTADQVGLLDAEDEDFPKIVHGAPVPTMDRLLELTALLKPPSAPVKMREESNVFLYHASDRAWAKKLNLSSADYDTATKPISDILEHVFFSNSQEKNPYYYVSYEIRSPAKSSFVGAAAPYLRGLGGRSSLPPQMRLWLSSAGATASWHYDMESNFFVQITGMKTFLLANADAYLFLNPQSYLHPNWRQSEHDEVTSIGAVVRLAIAYMDASINVSCSGRSTNHHRLNPICRYMDIRRAHPEKSKEEIVTDLFGLAEATLSAGDILHIPPFFFHCVISGINSSSLNAWLGSKELSISNKLENVPLPFQESASLQWKIQAIRYSIVRLFVMFGHGGVAGIEYKLFVAALRNRYRSIVQGSCNDHTAAERSSSNFDPKAACPAAGCGERHAAEAVDLMSACSWDLSSGDIEQIEAGYDKSIKRTASLLYTHLERLMNDVSKRNLLLLDYIEEVLDFVYGAESSPCALLEFTDYCLQLPFSYQPDPGEEL